MLQTIAVTILHLLPCIFGLWGGLRREALVLETPLGAGLRSKVEDGAVQTLLLLGLGEVLGVVLFLRNVGVAGEEHGPPHGEVNGGHQGGHPNDHDAHPQEPIRQGHGRGGEEDRLGDGRASVAAGADEPGGSAQATAGDEGGHAKGGAAGHWNEDGPHDDDGDGAAHGVAGNVHETRAHAAHGLHGPEKPEAAAHPEPAGDGV